MIRKRRILFSLFLSVALPGCGGGVEVYRSPSQGDAMFTCSGAKRYHVESQPEGELSARGTAEKKAQEEVKAEGGCGLLITSEKLDAKSGTYAIDYQKCGCR